MAKTEVFDLKKTADYLMNVKDKSEVIGMLRGIVTGVAGACSALCRRRSISTGGNVVAMRLSKDIDSAFNLDGKNVKHVEYTPDSYRDAMQDMGLHPLGMILTGIKEMGWDFVLLPEEVEKFHEGSREITGLCCGTKDFFDKIGFTIIDEESGDASNKKTEDVQ